MSWSREQVQALIEQYRQNPCLYAVRSAAYKNRHARQAALETIHANIAALRPSVTMAEIKTKFQGLRSTFTAEHKKYQSSLRSGAGTDQVCIIYLDKLADIKNRM
nr:unnamed protein product [Callosobruchus analis]